MDFCLGIHFTNKLFLQTVNSEIYVYMVRYFNLFIINIVYVCFSATGIDLSLL